LPELDTIACLCCGGEARRPAWAPEGARLCAACGSATLAPDSGNGTGAGAAETYQQDYFTGEKDEGVDYQASKRQMQLINHSRLDFLASLPGSPAAGASLLELGCALGFFMEAAHERGMRPYGVEISEFAAGKAREIFGENVIAGELHQAPAQWQGMDLAASFHVFEHLPDPAGVLAQ
jgi:2-polyprenyl-3-methyl-5-hydroxy-6-metoxy-1,4-benzoquinol methylase